MTQDMRKAIKERDDAIDRRVHVKLPMTIDQSGVGVSFTDATLSAVWFVPGISRAGDPEQLVKA